MRRRGIHGLQAVEDVNGHAGSVTSIAFSPDGQFVTTGDEGYLFHAVTDGSFKKGWSSAGARVWSVATGGEVNRFVPMAKLNALGVTAVAFSPEGRTFLTACKVDQTLRLWDRTSGKQVRSLVTSERGDISSVAYSPDGRSILTAGALQRYACLWDVETGALKIRFKGAGVDLGISTSCSRDGRYMLKGAMDQTGDIQQSVARLWDIEAGEVVASFARPEIKERGAVISPDGRFVVFAGEDGVLRIRDRATGADLQQLRGHSKLVSSLAWSLDDRYLLTGSADMTARLWDLGTGREIQRFKAPVAGMNRPRTVVDSTGLRVALSPDGRFAATVGVDGSIVLWDVKTGKQIYDWRYPHQTFALPAFARFSPDGRSLLVGGHTVALHLLDLATAARSERMLTGGITSLEYSPDGRFLALAFSQDVRLLDAVSLSELRRFSGHSSSVRSILFPSNGRFLITGSDDGTTRFWDLATGRELCKLISFKNGRWVVVDPEGRFDTNDLDQAGLLHWVLPDDPFTPLPLELFLRDYYEPRLLTRLLSGEVLPPVRPIAEINPVRPTVKILDAYRDQNAPEQVTIRVQIVNASTPVRQAGAMSLRKGGAYDLRLFRDGQIVASAPMVRDMPRYPDDDLTAWRRDTRIDLDPDTQSAVITFPGIMLPRTAGVTRGEFSAYCFNEDRIKSTTDSRSFAVPDDLPPLAGKAYIVTVGVNTNLNPSLNLRFAANDARQIQDSLARELKQGNQYREVVSISLISDGPGGSSVEAPATKANIRAVTDLLAGRSVSQSTITAIPNAELIRKACPQDLVIFAFSGHGFTSGHGDFYLAPHDTGTGPPSELPATCVSSAELSLWLRDVDAGEMVLIVDACHSAALVEGEGFKPGPMGSRGLGQLAYDKGMLVLAATQADNVALESERIRQGLLTHALVRDGIGSRAADYAPKDGKITLTEWLSYAGQRVPHLYDEIRQGKLREIVHDDEPLSAGKYRELRVQRPVLFDFSKGRREIIIAR